MKTKNVLVLCLLVAVLAFVMGFFAGWEYYSYKMRKMLHKELNINLND